MIAALEWQRMNGSVTRVCQAMRRSLDGSRECSAKRLMRRKVICLSTNDAVGGGESMVSVIDDEISTDFDLISDPPTVNLPLLSTEK
ncbi:hypothetical protein VV869_19110 [Photobacterium sp. MCCC 1A19761]|uniref:hypothetical protein n=1 Tax=Photobacterium sp. MCCC 1A19761 TaxID=3115000 RepID=UPI00307E355D